MDQHRTTRATRLVATAGVLLTVSAGLVACGGADGSSATTLRISDFGNFGYDKLIKQFEAAHPGVKVVETTEGDLGTYNTQLTQKVAAGSAPGDVVAIEEGQIVNFLQSPDTFVNFQKYGVSDAKGQWLPWKWAQATTADGGDTIGLGTDVGGLAMCYRSDLFAKAGLPTDRDEVAKLWPTWQDYIKVGEQFQQGIGTDKVHFIDSATNTYNSILMQSASETYFDKSGQLVITSNPAVKNAWDTALDMVSAGLSAKLKAFSTEWNSGFKNDSFATIACPAWMTAYIKSQAGDSGAGRWDITTVPGGSGSWGGSFLAVPTSSSHQKLAVELAEFLSSAKGQLGAFQEAGNFPSNPTLYDTPAIADAKNAYFSDAPIGELFAAGATQLKPVYLGARNQPVRDAVENAMRSVEDGQASSSQGWDAAVEGAEAAAK